jgi:hypothetical protein
MTKELIVTHIFKIRTYSEQERPGFLHDTSLSNLGLMVLKGSKLKSKSYESWLRISNNSDSQLCVYGSHSSGAQELSPVRCNQKTEHIQHRPPFPPTQINLHKHSETVIGKINPRGCQRRQMFGGRMQKKGETNDVWRIFPVINLLQPTGNFTYLKV